MIIYTTAPRKWEFYAMLFALTEGTFRLRSVGCNASKTTGVVFCSHHHSLLPFPSTVNAYGVFNRHFYGSLQVFLQQRVMQFFPDEVDLLVSGYLTARDVLRFAFSRLPR